MFTKSIRTTVKALDPTAEGEGDGTFEAIVAVFNNIDSYGDRILPGAFTETLAEWEASDGLSIPVYYSHRMDDPQFNIGHVIEAKETEKGLWVKAQLDFENPTAKQVWRLLKGGRLAQFSFAYDVEAYQVVKGADDAESVWELQKLKLYEVGPTPIGANQETELLGVKHAAHVADRLAAGLKAGRVLSAKNEGDIRAAHEALGKVLSTLDNEDDGSKASGHQPAKDEELLAAKSEEPMGAPSALTRLQIELAAGEFATL